MARRVTYRVVVIGGGVSGLAVGYELIRAAGERSRPLRLTVLEAGDTPGGNIRTEHERGFTLEWGPTGFLDNAPATLELARRLGLEDRLLPASDAARDRYIYRAGSLRRVPTSPPAFLASGILPLPAKLRLLAEPFVSRGAVDRDRSIHEFAAHRIGERAATVLVGAMVSGIYAGDIRQLSLPATFPKMQAMEKEHGSLFRAMLARRRAARQDGGAASGGPAGPAGRLTSFESGLHELIDALAAELGDRLRTGTPVTSVTDMGNRGFRVVPAKGRPIDADAVVLSCPAWHAAPLVEATDPDLAAELQAIPSASLAVVHFGYSAGTLGREPAGFGYLVPRGEDVRSLGSLWTSSFFAGRAPRDRVLITTMIGGAHDPEAVELDDAALTAQVRADLQKTMDVSVAPYHIRIHRHPRGIPQYTLGHLDRVAAIEARLAAHPRLFVAGNSYRGISMNLCIEEAPRVAAAVLDAAPAARGAAASGSSS